MSRRVALGALALGHAWLLAAGLASAAPAPERLTSIHCVCESTQASGGAWTLLGTNVCVGLCDPAGTPNEVKEEMPPAKGTEVESDRACTPDPATGVAKRWTWVGQRWEPGVALATMTEFRGAAERPPVVTQTAPRLDCRPLKGNPPRRPPLRLMTLTGKPMEPGTRATQKVVWTRVETEATGTRLPFPPQRLRLVGTGFRGEAARPQDLFSQNDVTLTVEDQSIHPGTSDPAQPPTRFDAMEVRFASLRTADPDAVTGVRVTKGGIAGPCAKGDAPGATEASSCVRLKPGSAVQMTVRPLLLPSTTLREGTEKTEPAWLSVPPYLEIVLFKVHQRGGLPGIKVAITIEGSPTVEKDLVVPGWLDLSDVDGDGILDLPGGKTHVHAALVVPAEAPVALHDASIFEADDLFVDAGSRIVSTDARDATIVALQGDLSARGDVDVAATDDVVLTGAGAVDLQGAVRLRAADAIAITSRGSSIFLWPAVSGQLEVRAGNGLDLRARGPEGAVTLMSGTFAARRITLDARATTSVWVGKAITITGGALLTTDPERTGLAGAAGDVTLAATDRIDLQGGTVVDAGRNIVLAVSNPAGVVCLTGGVVLEADGGRGRIDVTRVPGGVVDDGTTAFRGTVLGTVIRGDCPPGL